MPMKTASSELYARIRSASSLIAAGVRLHKPDIERRGRADFALAHIENQIRLYGEDLTTQSRAFLARLLFDTTPATTNSGNSADEDATADAEETTAELNQELIAIHHISTPADMVPTSMLNKEELYDPDNEYEEEETD